MDALQRIVTVFSESVFTKYKRKRFGFKNCSNIIDEDLADDLMHLLIRAREMDACGCNLPGSCSLTRIEERINTI